MGGGGRAMSKPTVSAMHCWMRPTLHTLHEALLGVVIGVRVERTLKSRAHLVHIRM